MTKDSAGSHLDAAMTLTRRIRDAISILRSQSYAVRPEDWLALQSEVVILRLEWLDTLEKINTWAARLAKRDERALDKLASGVSEQDASGGSNGDLSDGHALAEFVPGHILPK